MEYNSLFFLLLIIYIVIRNSTRKKAKHVMKERHKNPNPKESLLDRESYLQSWIKDNYYKEFVVYKILLSIIETQYLSQKEIQKWAYEVIDRVDKPHSWIINLATASNEREARKAIYEIEDSDSFPDSPIFSKDYCAQLIGLYYLNYINGRISLDEFINQAGGCADCYEFYEMPVERIYAIGDSVINKDNYKQMIDNHFFKYGERSKKVVEYITSFECLEKDIEIFVDKRRSQMIK